MTITIRSEKGSELTHAEMDENFTDLRDRPNGMTFPSDKTLGIKIDLVTPEFGWHDIVGHLFVEHAVGIPADFAIYRGGIRAFQFPIEGTEVFVDFHIPHDYVHGTPIYIHVHWSHNSTLVTSGSVTWAFEIMYSKGHNQAPFGVPVIISVIDAVNTTQYQHQIAENVASTSGGSAVLLDTNELEVDGVIQCRLYLDSNDIVTSDASAVHPYAHFVDIHYQSTGLPTKNRAPDFWA